MRKRGRGVDAREPTDLRGESKRERGTGGEGGKKGGGEGRKKKKQGVRSRKKVLAVTRVSSWRIRLST